MDGLNSRPHDMLRPRQLPPQPHVGVNYTRCSGRNQFLVRLTAKLTASGYLPRASEDVVCERAATMSGCLRLDPANGCSRLSNQDEFRRSNSPANTEPS